MWASIPVGAWPNSVVVVDDLWYVETEMVLRARNCGGPHVISGTSELRHRLEVASLILNPPSHLDRQKSARPPH